MKKNFSFFVALVLFLIVIPSTSVKAEVSFQEPVITFTYMDFIYAIDKAVGENEHGYYVKDKKFITNYINSNYEVLRNIKIFESKSQLQILSHVEDTIRTSNMTYNQEKIEANSRQNFSVSTLSATGGPSGYTYWKINHYTKNTWWGVSHWMGTKTAIISYGNQLNKAAYAGGAITAVAALAGGLPAAVTGLNAAYMGYLGTDLLEQSQYFNTLFLDIPGTFIPYKFYR